VASEGQSEGFGIPGIGSVMGAQRALGGAIEDIRTIAEGMRLIPELVRILTSIEKHVTAMEGEVSRMRNGVDGLRGQISGLEEAMEQVFEPLAEIGLTLRPLKRGANRISRMGRRTPVPQDPPAPE
jgi:hypothetical protein